jgi:hypothetical protein
LFLTVETIMPHHSRQIRLDEALQLPGCPVCRVVLQRVEQSLESISYELVLDPAYRETIDAAWGFCTVHAQQWLEQAPPLGTAIIYEAVLGRIERQLDRHDRTRANSGGLRAKLGGARVPSTLTATGVCPLCRLQSDHEANVIGQLLDELRDVSFRDRYAVSDGICVPHMQTALAAGPPTEILDALRVRMLETHRQLQDHLRAIIRKHDHRFRHEPVGDELGAPGRAVRQVAGAPGLTSERE